MKIIEYKTKRDIFKTEKKRVLVAKDKEIICSKPKKFCCDEMKKAWDSTVTHNNGYGMHLW